MDLRRTLGENVRRLRERERLSQEELAHRAKVHVTYLSGVENGHRNPSLEVMGRLAGALGVGAAELLQPRKC